MSDHPDRLDSDELRSPVASYLADAYAAAKVRGMDATEFARWARIHRPALVAAVLDIIGMWSSSKPELRALQRIYP